MSIEHLYPVYLHWSGSRKGKLSSPDFEQSVEVATPVQFTGGMSGYWSPEHLFTAAISSCFMTTFLAIAENSKLPFSDFEISANGKLEMVDGKYAMSRVMLYPKLTLAAGSDQEKALRILEKTERSCLISNSVKSAVEMKPEIVVT